MSARCDYRMCIWPRSVLSFHSGFLLVGMNLTNAHDTASSPPLLLLPSHSTHLLYDPSWTMLTPSFASPTVSMSGPLLLTHVSTSTESSLVSWFAQKSLV